MKGVLMKFPVLAFGMMLSSFGFATSNEVVPPVYYGSCSFEGQFASGCIEFYDGAWTTESTQQFCKAQSKAGTTPVISTDYCPRADFNTLCSAVEDDGSVAHFYVNNMPAFICKKYMSGVLTKR